jgi:hypothetical protein
MGASMLYSLSSLKAKDLKAIQKLEEELGSPLLAFSGVPVDGAKMGKEKLRKLQALEKKLGVVLVAVQPD